jgi:hypothetical protein
MQAALILLALSAADYQIDATLDPERHELKASAEVSWTNTTTVPISELYWHLYLNAFRDKESTFMKESKGRLRRTTFVEGQYGHIEVQELSAGGRDLLAVSTFEHPDDDNERDRTVLRTPLEKPIGAGEKIVVNIRFTSKLPRVFARSGWAPPSFMMFGQWFPKLGVLNEEPGRAPAWNCHQYHGTGEFFADFATYRVVITAPREIEIGATGRRTATRRGSNHAPPAGARALRRALLSVRRQRDEMVRPLVWTLSLRNDHAHRRTADGLGGHGDGVSDALHRGHSLAGSRRDADRRDGHGS